METRYCNGEFCKKERPSEDFYQLQSGRFRCKECARRVGRKYYERHRIEIRERKNKEQNLRYSLNPKKHAEIARQYRKRLRIEFIIEYGGKCTCCGEMEIAFLTLHYINNDGAGHRKKYHTSAGQLADLRRRGWPKDEYELLCFNCNRASWELGKCPHKNE